MDERISRRGRVRTRILASYIGMLSSEHSSGGRQRLSAMSKQGNTLLRYLLCEAAMHAIERDSSR
jgi:transposase